MTRHMWQEGRPSRPKKTQWFWAQGDELIHPRKAKNGEVRGFYIKLRESRYLGNGTSDHRNEKFQKTDPPKVPPKT